MKRELWVDLSTSVRWGGGVIGIVRAELEMARALYSLYPQTRFVAFNGHSFVEMEHERIRWLFEDTSVVDTYLKARDYFRAAARFQQPVNSEGYPRYQRMLAGLPAVPNDRLRQLRLSMLFGATAIPAPSSELLLQGLIKLYQPVRRVKPTLSKPAASERKAVVNEFEEPESETEEVAVEHPFGPNATVFCAGWMDTGRERPLATIKKKSPGLKISQLVYDVIPIHEDLAHLYPETGSKRFENYFSWVAKNSHTVFCGGANTAKDVSKYQAKLGLPTPPAFPVRFGDAQLVNELHHDPVRDIYPDDTTLLRQLRICKPYLLCVGTIEARKNHAVLYEAMRMLFDRHGEKTPLMVFAGISHDQTRELMDSVARDPKTRDHILHLVPNDQQLQVAYRNAAFTVLPTRYEGWSLTLPESLSFGKFVLAADVPPLREIGEDRVEYLSPDEPQLWADRMDFYLQNPQELAAREKHIRNTWKPNDWRGCARTVLEGLGFNGKS